MPNPIRTSGLQIQAVLSMGNSLYAVLVGTTTGAISIILTNKNIFGEQQIFFGLYHIVLLLTVVLITIYFLIDWHDLNRAAFIDDDIGISQMVQWVVAILLISISIILCGVGIPLPCSILSFAYLPLSLRLRDNLIHPIGLTEQEKTAGDGYEKAQKDEKVKNIKLVTNILQWIYFFLLLATLCQLFFISMEIKTTQVVYSFGCFLAWLLALIVKCYRSKYVIEPSYKIAINNIMSSQ